jgi:hypothetical protein
MRKTGTPALAGRLGLAEDSIANNHRGISVRDAGTRWSLLLGVDGRRARTVPGRGSPEEVLDCGPSPLGCEDVIAPVEAANLRCSGTGGIVDSLLVAQHSIEMFRRSLPDGPPRHRLDQFTNRLTEIVSEVRQLNPAG